MNRKAPLIEGKPIRAVLRWQLVGTVFAMLGAGILMGRHAAVSALLGGLVNVVAGVVFGMVATHSRKRTAPEALIAMLRAEAIKVILIVAQLWLVLVNYRGLVPVVFFGTFVVTVIFFSMAILVRER